MSNEEDYKKGSFGMSEPYVFTSTGRLKILEETEEVCTVCEDSTNGPANYGIIRETPQSVTLCCPNCGEQKTVFPDKVLRKSKAEKQQEEESRLERIRQEMMAKAKAGQD